MVLAFGAVIALLLADTYVLTPLWEARTSDAELRESLERRQRLNEQTLAKT